MESTFSLQVSNNTWWTVLLITTFPTPLYQLNQLPHMHLTDSLVMLEGTYILVGTWGIPLHTWHALPSETASVTLWPEGYSRPGRQESQPFCLTSPRNEAHVHYEFELNSFVMSSAPPLHLPVLQCTTSVSAPLSPSEVQPQMLCEIKMESDSCRKEWAVKLNYYLSSL